MKRITSLVICLMLTTCIALSGVLAAPKVTLKALMEDIPENRIVEKLLPEFESKTGIQVKFEFVQYGDMHAKLITQFLSQNTEYDIVQVDNYWAGEFPAAGWLEPLTKYVKRDKFDLSPYIPSMLKMIGYYQGKLYMIPQYNYAMGMIYRTDLLQDPNLQKKFKETYKKPLELPNTVAEYVRLCEFMSKNAGVSGSAMQAGRGDPIVMEWTNYLYSCGGDYYDSKWRAIVNSPKAIAATKLYIDNVKKGAPTGALSYNLDDAYRVMSQGKAFSMISYHWMLPQLNDEANSKVAGKVALAPMPGGKGLNGGWGWGIAHNTQNKEEVWRFISWIESKEVVTRRAVMGGAPTRKDVFSDPAVIAKSPWYPMVQKIVENAKPVPEFTYSTEMIEVLGRELSLAASGDKSVEASLNQAAKELNELAKKAKLQK
ncbi:MAG TPA: ABC transporter substrate-binding protein [Firmicutes bacterium]|jgi:multiple sugar transport system substrate-binding protein|nr:ABC transporter substrate-binding protein [Bacillota bacterium]